MALSAYLPFPWLTETLFRVMTAWTDWPRGTMAALGLAAIAALAIWWLVSTCWRLIDTCFLPQQACEGVIADKFREPDNAAMGMWLTGLSRVPIPTPDVDPEKFSVLVQMGNDAWLMDVTPKCHSTVRVGEPCQVVFGYGRLSGKRHLIRAILPYDG